MGSSVYTHIGPYIVIDHTPYTRDVTYACCNNAQCSEFHKHNAGTFCSKCGFLITMGTVEVTNTITWRDFCLHNDYAYEMDFESPESLGHENEDVVICCSEGVEFDTNGGYTPLADLLSNPNVLVDFMNKYDVALDAMRAFFPPGQLKIEYGVCSYWS